MAIRVSEPLFSSEVPLYIEVAIEHHLLDNTNMAVAEANGAVMNFYLCIRFR